MRCIVDEHQTNSSKLEVDSTANTSKRAHAREPVDPEKDDGKNSPIPVVISNPKVLDCYICFQPLTIPVFQCDNGHIACSTCYPKLRNTCPKCSLRISSKRCKAIENLLLSIELSCSNAKYGCREKISYIGKMNHEEQCIHEPCYCPLPDCDFVASSEVLSKHFSHKHGDSQTKFSYGLSVIVSLKSNDETIVLQENNVGKLFILNNSTMLFGNAINICCISPKSSQYECGYDILARSQACKPKFQSFAKNVQRFTLSTLSLEFLVIPFGSSEPLELEICISPMMLIYILTLTRKRIPLRIKSSDTIADVKEKILDNEGIPMHMQRLIFAGKELDNSLTLANYHIQEKSTLKFVLRIMGD
ncbi:E3 ubiquitin-protein ligase SINA-like 10 [Medicago truncatula]|uniref:E3 ubiquitin-protein ligase SINA-like 10 n=1 Tax=Medicago truncatula TaxID=3880 RepID=UPI000D2F3F64|nr:E3 ubiquitin-protein ligase SINA-like 10 [Medicago truncatula]